jgi:DNA-binding LacI/PurR family transcriptional regulator
MGARDRAGVERVAGRNHLAVVLSEMQGRRTPGRGWIEGVLARRPTGVIAVFSDLDESMRSQLAARDIPYVVVDPTGEPLHDTPSIGATNWNGGLTATRHLLSLATGGSA